MGDRGLMTEPGEASPQAGGRCLNTSTGWSSSFPNLSPCEKPPPSPDYSGFPHTEACNASSTRVLGATHLSPDR